MKWLERHALYLAWLVALIATLASLYYGEILRLEPCRLCWYQRIAMFPLALWLGMATYRNEPLIALYALPLAGIGALIAFYHSLIVLFPQLHVTAICGDTACTLAGVAPFLSFGSFLLITSLLLFLRKLPHD